jgi:hypothetical protein
LVQAPDSSSRAYYRVILKLEPVELGVFRVIVRKRPWPAVLFPVVKQQEWRGAYGTFVPSRADRPVSIFEEYP